MPIEAGQSVEGIVPRIRLWKLNGNFKFSEQLRGAVMYNNIAEGSGSASKKEFQLRINLYQIITVTFYIIFSKN